MTERLDLAEGKRLLSEDEAMRERIRALPPDTPVVRFHGPDGVTALHKWLRNNAKSLLSAVEDAEKLRELLLEARDDAWSAGTSKWPRCRRCLGYKPQHGNLYDDRRGHRPECVYARIDAALTQPESTPGASSSS